MNKLFKFNAISSVFTTLISLNVIPVITLNVWGHPCWLFLLLVNIHLGCLFVMSSFGFAMSLISNSFLPIEERFIHPPALDLTPDNELSPQNLIRKEKLIFYSNGIAIYLISMLGLLVFRSYLETCGICSGDLVL